MSQTRREFKLPSKKEREQSFLEFVFDRPVVVANSLAQQLIYPKKEDVLTSSEKKIILYLISRVKKTDRAFDPRIIEVSLLAKIIGYRISGGSRLKQFKQSLIELANKKFEVGSSQLSINQWIKPPVFDKDNSTVELCLHDDMRHYVLKLEETPKTIFQYKYVAGLHKKHSVDLYLLLRSALRLQAWEEKISRFYWKLGNSYDYFSAVEKYVLIPCLNEINEQTDLIVDYTPVYKGRLVTSIKFSIHENIFHTGGDVSDQETLKANLGYQNKHP